METILAKKIKDKIHQEGPIPFRDFMALALYDSEHGFYTKGPGIGTLQGTFNTNAMFPGFAFALAQAIQMAEELVGESLRILEFGGGTGELATNILSFLPTPCEYVIIDSSPGFRARQSQRRIQNLEDVDDLPQAPTFVFGNEILDALPVHRVMGNGSGELLEFFVGVDGKGEFVEEPIFPSTPRLVERLRSEGVTLGRGQIAEICLELEGFIEKIVPVMTKGYLIFIDYGDEARCLYSHSRRNGTLRSFHNQQIGFSPFHLVGEQDLTADVDFTALISAARKAGFQSDGHVSQETWLKNLRIENYRNFVGDALKAEQEIAFLTSPARLGSTFEVVLLKTPGLPDGPGLHLN